MTKAFSNVKGNKASVAALLGVLVIDSPSTQMYSRGDLEDVFVVGQLKEAFTFTPESKERVLESFMPIHDLLSSTSILKERVLESFMPIHDLLSSTTIFDAATPVEGDLRLNAAAWCKELSKNQSLSKDFGITNSEGKKLRRIDQAVYDYHVIHTWHF